MIGNRQALREAKQLFRLCVVDSALDEDRVRQVVQQAVESSRHDARLVLNHFSRLVKLNQSQHTAIVESARPLPPDLRAVTKAKLDRLYGPGLTTNFCERPSLIGGVRIQVGSDVYDGSIQGRLAALEKRF
jgi:F-type H+-transporting ATPase subunit delta